jgi:hypothetical protein
MKSNECYILKVNDRYLIGFSKKNRIKTAWCLLGAKLFSLQDVKKYEIELIKRKLLYKIILLQVPEDNKNYESEYERQEQAFNYYVMGQQDEQ